MGDGTRHERKIPGVVSVNFGDEILIRGEEM